MPSPLLSVAMCTYNGARYIEAQLDSILAQSLPVHEIVICDDGSSDETVRIANRVAARTEIPITVHRNKERLGVTRNFERAIGLTRGDIVFLSDQDDVWDREKSARMAAELLARPRLLMLFTDAELVDETGSSLGRTLFQELRFTRREKTWIRHGEAFRALVRRNLASGATVAIRRDLFSMATPFPEVWLQDEWLATIAAALDRIDFFDEPLIKYRQHQSNQIGMRPMTWKEKLDQVTRASGDFHGKLEARATQLLDRLNRLPQPPSAKTIHLAEEKLAHAKVRGQLPQQVFARFPGIAAEILRGRYFRCATGWRSIARDFLSPIRARK
jgi:glycosyltransferase involved in cell wall biosynthesis